MASALPRGPREHFQLGDTIQTSLATPKATPPDTYFDPQPQYIKLERPTTQFEIENQIELEASSQLQQDKDVVSAGPLGTWGGVHEAMTKADIMHILEDWKAWKQQFDRQAGQRSCRFSRRGCALWKRR